PSRFMLLPSIPSLSCLIPPPPLPTLFPYTTLFRSPLQHRAGREAEPSPRRHGGRAGERMPRADSLVFPAAPPAENVAVSVCTEGLRSGRTRRTRNALGGNPASWVQIPPPPPIFIHQEGCWSGRTGTTGNRVRRHGRRGFKSLPFRQRKRVPEHPGPF